MAEWGLVRLELSRDGWDWNWVALGKFGAECELPGLELGGVG